MKSLTAGELEGCRGRWGEAISVAISGQNQQRGNERQCAGRIPSSGVEAM